MQAEKELKILSGRCVYLFIYLFIYTPTKLSNSYPLPTSFPNLLCPPDVFIKIYTIYTK